jgi:hypothetical protein
MVGKAVTLLSFSEALIDEPGDERRFSGGFPPGYSIPAVDKSFE